MASDDAPVPPADQPDEAPAKAKHGFSNAERFAVWRAYDEACFWCGEPLSFRAAEIDHVIAESLADHPARYASLLKELGLPGTYGVNDFPNWVPACRACNGRKGATTFRPVPMILFLLERTQELGEVARGYAAEILSDRAKGLLLARLAKATERGEVTDEDLSEVGAKLLARFTPVVRILKSRAAGLHLEGDWTVVQDYQDGTALVVGPEGSGRTALGADPDPRFLCDHCGRWGPWRGVNCIQCGNSQIPDHGE